jgi:PAS domain S-box-containing protein
MEISSERDGTRPAVLSWRNLILAALAVKLLATVALKQTPELASYSAALYALVLLLATGLSIQNAVQRTLGNRSFWVFLAVGCGLWSFNHWMFVYYELGLRMDIPDISIADAILFLHTIVLMAAVTVRPHLDRPAPKLSRSTLNFLLLLFFWVFLYVFLLLPYQYVSWNSEIYNQRFELLFSVANIVLIAALGVATWRAQPPWRSIYGYLCAASALVAVVSTVANLANDFGGHYNVQVYAVGKILGVCLMAWIPLRARLLQPHQSDAAPSRVDQRYTSLFAMLAVVAVPVIGVWELFRPGEIPAFRAFRLSAVLIFVIFLAVFALVRELLANRELTVDNAQAWSAAIESEGRFRTMTDQPPVMIWMSDADKLFSFFNQAWLDFTGRARAEELWDGWVSGVHPDDRQRCMSAYSLAFNERVPFEIEFRLRRFDGKYRWILDYGVPRFDSDGRFCGYIGSCIDITSRKSNEESLQKLGGRLITAHEEERTRIAAELQEDLNQRMAVVLIELGLLARHVPGLSPHISNQLDSIAGMLAGLTAEIQGISHRLHPYTLDILGLEAAVTGLHTEFSRQGLKVRFVYRNMPGNVPRDVTLCIFRIAQEALSNIVKHSGANEADVELSGEDPNFIELSISDTGAGFDVDSMKAHGGLGLPSIRERARLVGGHLSIESQPSQGARINVRIPLSRPVVTLDPDQTAHQPRS